MSSLLSRRHGSSQKIATFFFKKTLNETPLLVFDPVAVRDALPPEAVMSSRRSDSAGLLGPALPPVVFPSGTSSLGLFGSPNRSKLSGAPVGL